VSARLRWSLAIFALWTALAVLFTPQSYLGAQGRPSPPSWGVTALSQLPMFWSWALLTPAVIWFGRRLPLEPPHRTRNVVLYALGGFAFAFVHIYMSIAGHWIVTSALGAPRLFPLQRLMVAYGATNVMICWGILAASQALTWFRRYQDRELRLVEAQLHSLKTQLHPHFLFNTLNAIAELLHEDPKRAERTLMQLSDLLRTALGRGDRQEVALADEIAFSRTYVAIQQTLLDERLAVQWQVADDTLDAAVPVMLLQPLVENAVRHGISPKLDGGTIVVTTRRDGDALTIAVEDDGVGVNGARAGQGVGIANTRARLGHLYGDQHAFELAPRAAGGTVATVRIPFRRMPIEATPQ
jgi:two-component system LytT family sensor kinase